MKKAVNPFDYAGQIMNAVERGTLITAGANGRVNPMAIGWGTLGVEWNKRIFIAYVRESRYTQSLLNENPEFTVNIPLEEYDKKAIAYCGTKSGRDVNKVEELGLTLEEPQVISVPGIREFPLTLECRVIYTQKQELDVLERESSEKFYPVNPDAEPSQDLHTAYYGEIVAAYIICED